MTTVSATIVSPAGPRCRTCCHWLRRPYVEHEGECRRNAPQAALAENPHDAPLLVAVWPLTGDDEWCGEWAQQ